MLLIFDWDGTLSDSTNKIIDCVQQAANTAGFRVCDDAEIKNIIGLGLPEAMQRLYPELDTSAREQIRRHYVEHFVAADQQPSPFFEGVLEGLHALRDARFSLCIATGKSRRGLSRVLSNLGMTRFFHGSRCADETASKPHPLMLVELLSEFSCGSDQAVMVGDTEYDMSMAQQIDMPRVAVTYGAHSIERLLSYNPLLSVDHFSVFVDWVLARYS